MEPFYPIGRPVFRSLPREPASDAALHAGPGLANPFVRRPKGEGHRGSGTGGAAMKRCGYCGRAVWSTPGGEGRVCRECDETLRSDATTRVARIRACLATARGAGDLDAALPRLQEAMEHVGKLVTYDRLGVRPIIPEPSLLTAMLESHRGELARRPRNRNNGGGGSTRGPSTSSWRTSPPKACCCAPREATCRGAGYV